MQNVVFSVAFVEKMRSRKSEWYLTKVRVVALWRLWRFFFTSLCCYCYFVFWSNFALFFRLICSKASFFFSSVCLFDYLKRAQNISESCFSSLYSLRAIHLLDRQLFQVLNSFFSLLVVVALGLVFGTFVFRVWFICVCKGELQLRCHFNQMFSHRNPSELLIRTIEHQANSFLDLRRYKFNIEMGTYRIESNQFICIDENWKK